MKNKKTLIVFASLIVLVAAFALIYFKFLPQGTTDAKTITVAVVLDEETTNTYTIETSEEFLRGALEQEELVEGTDTDYGLYILTVDGVTADESIQQWWCVTIDGVMAEYGVDSIAVEDGEKYEITLVTGW